MKIRYLTMTNQDLRIEHEQLLDEGRELSELVEEEFHQLEGLNLEEDPSLQTRVQALMDLAEGMPMRADYPYVEPSDLESIWAECPQGSRRLADVPDDKALYDHLLGAWQGRCGGCLLGKPVEGWYSSVMWPYLRDLDRYPLRDYFRSDVPEEIVEKYHVNRNRAYIDRVSHMVEDDDTNYTVMGLAIYEQHGPDFNPEDVGLFWLQNMPLLHTFTAERIAYRNLGNLVPPPNSGSYRNPYREWIGAQIRADFWGYLAVGNPQLAAEYAWRDASISHVKNGIYGEMWVAAMLAAAPFVRDIREVIQIGLSEVPKNSRLAENIQQVLDWRDQGLSYEEVLHEVHEKWDETWRHHWCHTLSNAQIVAVGLLWGEDNYETSICRAVQACFDTDCNGATVGSIFGMLHGAGALPEKWIGPLNDGLETGIAGYAYVQISDMARKTAEMVRHITDGSEQ